MTIPLLLAFGLILALTMWVAVRVAPKGAPPPDTPPPLTGKPIPLLRTVIARTCEMRNCAEMATHGMRIRMGARAVADLGDTGQYSGADAEVANDAGDWSDRVSTYCEKHGENWCRSWQGMGFDVMMGGLAGVLETGGHMLPERVRP